MLLVAEEENMHASLFNRKRPLTSLKSLCFILQTGVSDIIPGLFSFDQFILVADSLFFVVFRCE